MGLSGINTECVPEDTRSFASGIETSVRNMLGYFAGALLPGLFMDFIASIADWDVDETTNTVSLQEDTTYLYCTGLAFIFCAGVFPYFVMGRASKGASEALTAARERALQQLRKAIMNESLKELKAALYFAKTVELSATNDGEAVMGMVNEIIGDLSCKESANGSSPRSRVSRENKAIFGGKIANSVKVSGATRTELIAHIEMLEAELERLRPLNDDLERRLMELEQERLSLRPPSAGGEESRARQLTFAAVV